MKLLNSSLTILIFSAMDVDENQQNAVNFDPNDFVSSVDKMLGKSASHLLYN